MEEYICKWCREPLRWEKNKGFVHLDGEKFRKKIDTISGEEIEAIDHMAMAEKVEEKDRVSLGRLKRSLRRFQRWLPR